MLIHCDVYCKGFAKNPFNGTKVQKQGRKKNALSTPLAFFEVIENGKLSKKEVINDRQKFHFLKSQN